MCSFTRSIITLLQNWWSLREDCFFSPRNGLCWDAMCVSDPEESFLFLYVFSFFYVFIVFVLRCICGECWCDLLGSWKPRNGYWAQFDIQHGHVDASCHASWMPCRGVRSSMNWRYTYDSLLARILMIHLKWGRWISISVVWRWCRCWRLLFTNLFWPTTSSKWLWATCSSQKVILPTKDTCFAVGICSTSKWMTTAGSTLMRTRGWCAFRTQVPSTSKSNCSNYLPKEYKKS